MIDKEMPNDGVNELLKSRYGREYLSKLQKQHEIDLIQPSDPRFQKVYGDKIKTQQKRQSQLEDISKAEWEKAQYEKNKSNQS